MEKIANFIKKSQNIAILAHYKTDCDAVCSSLSLKLALESIGKKADVLIDSNLSFQMQTLPYWDSINKKTIEKYDCYVCLDTATQERLGKNKFKIMKNRQISVALDHHATNEKFCKLNYVNEEYSSTCELLFDFFNLLNIKISKDMAKLMLTGIYTDTGKLSYNNAKPKTMSIVSSLLKIYGEPISNVCEPIFSNKTMGEFELTKFVYSNLELCENNQIAYLAINREDFKKLNTTIEDTHGLTDVGMSLACVKVMILASQDNVEDCYYVSIRSKGTISARKIGEAFGGGGHVNASGCKIFDNAKNVKEMLIKEAKKVLV